MRARSIRRNLTAVSILSILAVWSLSVAIIFFQHRAAQERALAANDRLATLVDELVSTFFSERFLNLLYIAGSGDAPAGIGLGEMERFIDSFPYFENILVLDAGGRVLRAARGGAQIEGFDYSSQLFFREAREDAISLSGVYISMATGKPIITGSVKSEDAVLAADMDIVALSDAMARIKASPYSRVSVLDRFGRFVYDENMSRVVTERIDARFLELYGGAKLSGSVRYSEEEGGRSMLVTASPIPATGWTVLIRYDPAAEMAQTLAFLRASLVVLAIFVAVSFYVSYRTIGHVTRFLASFVHSTDLMAQGDHSISLGEAEYAEFTGLGKNFNAMVRAVVEREEALKERGRNLAEAEHRLKELNAELETKVADRTEKLARANEDLRASNERLGDALQALKATQSAIVTSEKMTALGRIAAGVAHELNTPLGIIESNLQLIARSLGRGLGATLAILPDLGPDARRLVERAAATVASSSFQASFPEPSEQRRMRDMARKALEAAGCADSFARADALISSGLPELAEDSAQILSGREGEAVLQVIGDFITPLQASRIASAAIEQASQVTGALRTYFSGNSAEKSQRIQLASQIGSVLALFRERVKRGTVISVDLGPFDCAWGKPDEIGRIWFNIVSNAIHAVEGGGYVRIWAETEERMCVVHVTDTGCGIPDDTKPDIFTPFFTTKPLGEGSGLGLSTARRLARANGGDIDFTSGGGVTDFRISLPNGPRAEA